VVRQVDCQLLYTSSNRDTSSGLLTSHGYDIRYHWNGIVGMGRIHVARQVNHRAECYLRCHTCGGNIRVHVKEGAIKPPFLSHCSIVCFSYEKKPVDILLINTIRFTAILLNKLYRGGCSCFFGQSPIL